MPRVTPKLSRSHLSSAAVVLVLAGMVTLAATKMNLGAASTALAHASLFWVGMAAAGVGAAFLARSESWYAAVRAALPHTEVRRSVVARCLMIGVATSAVTPARFGEAARTWLLARRLGGGHCATVLGTVVAQTLLNMLALALLALFTLTVSSTALGANPGTIAAAVVVPILLLGAVLCANRLLLSSFPATDPGAGAGIGRRAGCWVSRQLSGTGRGLAMFSRLASIVHAGGCQLLAWAMQGFTCFSVLMALHLHPSPMTAAAILLAVNVSAIVPVTPANVGLFQAACIAVLTPLGTPAGQALAYGLLLQGIEIAVALAMGLPAVLREGCTLRELGASMTNRGGLVAVAN